MKTYTSDNTYVDVHLHWDLQPDYVKHCIKYFRVFRNENLIGVTKLDRFIDTGVVVKDKNIYKVEAITLRNDKLASIEFEVKE